MSVAQRLVSVVDTVSFGLARVSGWLLFAVGIALAYEVIARRIFAAPTIWASELSELMMVWAVFLGLAWLVQADEHIRVTIIVDAMPPVGQRILRLVSLVVVLAFATLVAWHGLRLPYDNFISGRKSGSMLNLPVWWTQASLPAGLALVAVQCMAEMLRCLAPSAFRRGA